MEALNQFVVQYGSLLAQGSWDSVVMTLVSTLFAYILGIPLGVLVTISAPKGLKPNKLLYTVLGWIINVGRSLPFIILMVVLIPVTRLVAGTALGVVGAIVPLVIAATPFVGRMVEQSLLELDGGLIEAAHSFGASNFQIITKVYLHESLPSLIRGATFTFITLFGYSAIAGTVGAGGLGDIAIRYGYQRYQDSVMIAALIICVILIQVAQSLGDAIATKIDKRK